MLNDNPALARYRRWGGERDSDRKSFRLTSGCTIKLVKVERRKVSPVLFVEKYF